MANVVEVTQSLHDVGNLSVVCCKLTDYQLELLCVRRLS